MKKRILVILIVLVIAICVSVITVYAYNELTKVDLEDKVSSESTAFGKYVDSLKERNTKTVGIDIRQGTAMELSDSETTTKNIIYQYTYNQNDVSVDKRTDVYDTYDVYVDAEGTEYIYLYNTNLLCGIKSKNIYGVYTSQENAISEKEALNISNNFLLKNIEVASQKRKYELLNVRYDDREAIYIIDYVFKINGINTDDICSVWVTYEGEIGAFSMLYHNRYDSYINMTINKNDLDLKLANQMGKEDYKIQNCYLTKNTKGALVLAYQVFLTDKDVAVIIEIPVK